MDLFESFSGDPENGAPSRGGSSSGLSRRSVMKAGAAAAWSVPLVQVVAAAPAVAVSGTATQLAWTGLSAGYQSADARKLDVTAIIRNAGGVEASAVQIVLTVPVVNATVSTAPAGWSHSSSGQDFTFTKSTSLGSGNSDTLSVTFNLPTAAGSAMRITGAAGAGNAPFVSSSADVNAAGLSSVTTVGPGSSVPPSQSFATKTLTVVAAVKNAGPRTVRGITVTATLSRPTSTTAAPPTVTGAGWSISGGAGATSYTLSYAGDILPGDRTTDFTAKFEFGSNNAASASFAAAATSV